MKNGKLSGSGWIIIVGLLALLILAVYNAITNQQFMSTPAYSILNLLFVLGIAYYLTQRKNDERKLKDATEQIINRIQLTVREEKYSKIPPDISPHILTGMHRNVANKLMTIQDVCESFGCVDDWKFVNDQFTQYRDLVGNHIHEINVLSSMEIDLNKRLQLMDDRLDSLKIHLYFQSKNSKTV